MERPITDLHSHILPQWDDGAQSLEQALEMARMAVESGVTVMVATPHCTNTGAHTVRERYILLREALEECSIPLRLLCGMEILGTEETAALLQAGRLLTLNGSRYPLIEFPFSASEEGNTQILESVAQAGYCPVIAHPERYECVCRDPGCLRPWLEMGCLLQVNRGSLLGRFGSAVQDVALYLVERGLACAVASDAHSTWRRTPWLEDVYSMLEDRFSSEAARLLLWENPHRILQNQQTLPVPPAYR